MSSFYSEFSDIQIAKGGPVYRTLSVDGINEIKKIFEDLPVRTITKIKKTVMMNCLRPMYNEIKADLPVRTGMLKNSLKMRVTNKRTGVLYGQVTTSRPADHAAWIERGWWLTTHKTNIGIGTIQRRIRRIKGTRIFRNALERHANRIVDEFSKGIYEEAKKAEQQANGGA